MAKCTHHSNNHPAFMLGTDTVPWGTKNIRSFDYIKTIPFNTLKIKSHVDFTHHSRKVNSIGRSILLRSEHQ